MQASQLYKLLILHLFEGEPCFLIECDVILCIKQTFFVVPDATPIETDRSFSMENGLQWIALKKQSNYLKMEFSCSSIGLHQTNPTGLPEKKKWFFSHCF